MKGQDTAHSERRATQPTAGSEPGPAILPRPPAVPVSPYPAGRAPSDPPGQEPALPSPAAHAPAEGSPAEARAGTGAGRSAEARRGRCHPPQGAGPTVSREGRPRQRGREGQEGRGVLPHSVVRWAPAPDGDRQVPQERPDHPPPPALPASPPPGRDGPRPEIPRGLGASAGRGDAAAA